MSNQQVKDGGAAFPHPDGSTGPHGDWTWHENCGMSLRAYIATRSIAALRGHIGANADSSAIADIALADADALIAALAQDPQDHG